MNNKICLFLNNNQHIILDKSCELAQKRILQYNNCNYETTRLKSYIVGAMGEISVSFVLRKFFPFIEFKNHYRDNSSFSDIEIIKSKYKSIHIEIKTRSFIDFSIYGSQLRDNQIYKLRKEKNPDVQILILWINIDKYKVKLHGFNYLNDYNKAKITEKTDDFIYLGKPNIRKISDFFWLLYKLKPNYFNNEIHYNRKSNVVYPDYS